MPLDVGAIVPQLRAMSEALVDPRPIEVAAVDDALDALRRYAVRIDEVCERLGRTRTSWLCAEPTEPLDRVYPLPECPRNLTVLASDGSQIAPDPHEPVLCHVLNVGLVALTYGDRPGAELRSVPHLAWTEADVFLAVGGQRLLVEGDNLAVRRGARELQGLVDLAREWTGPGEVPVALRDGTLIEWTLQRGQDEEAREQLYEPFVAALDELRQLGVPVASYVSRPRSPYLVNMLRVAACDESEAACRDLCNTARLAPASGYPSPDLPLCARLRGVVDRQIFAALPLAAGERSALFKRAGKGSWRQVQAAADVHFFYVNTGIEIARVEVPDWVAADPSALDLIHAAVVDQCARGDGYPPALIEAHEQAVLGSGDREQFRRLLDGLLARHGVTLSSSGKASSKRRRAL